MWVCETSSIHITPARVNGTAISTIRDEVPDPPFV